MNFKIIVAALILSQSTRWDERPFGGADLEKEYREKKEKSEKAPPRVPEPPKREKEEDKKSPPQFNEPRVLTVDRLDRELEGTKYRTYRNQPYTLKLHGNVPVREFRVEDYDKALDLIYHKFRQDPRVTSIDVEDRSGKVQVRYRRGLYGKWEAVK
jgi:hypothetical protein